MDAGYFHVSAIVNTMAKILSLQISVQVPLSKYPELELLNRMVMLCLKFFLTAIQFSTAVALFYIPTSQCTRVPVYPHPRQFL